MSTLALFALALREEAREDQRLDDAFWLERSPPWMRRMYSAARTLMRSRSW